MGNTSKLKKPKRRDAAYYRQRQKNHVYTALIEFFADEAGRRGITKKEWAEAMGKDPAQITRWLTSPSNLELDTISDMLLPFEAEMEHRIVRFADRPKLNSAHALMRASVLPSPSQQTNPTRTSEPAALSGTKVEQKKIAKVEAKVSVSGV